jgi:hypothetical protein
MPSSSLLSLSLLAGLGLIQSTTARHAHIHAHKAAHFHHAHHNHAARHAVIEVKTANLEQQRESAPAAAPANITELLSEIEHIKKSSTQTEDVPEDQLLAYINAVDLRMVAVESALGELLSSSATAAPTALANPSITAEQQQQREDDNAMPEQVAEPEAAPTSPIDAQAPFSFAFSQSSPTAMPEANEVSAGARRTSTVYATVTLLHNEAFNPEDSSLSLEEMEENVVKAAETQAQQVPMQLAASVDAAVPTTFARVTTSRGV